MEYKKALNSFQCCKIVFLKTVQFTELFCYSCEPGKFWFTRNSVHIEDIQGSSNNTSTGKQNVACVRIDSPENFHWHSNVKSCKRDGRFKSYFANGQ